MQEVKHYICPSKTGEILPDIPRIYPVRMKSENTLVYSKTAARLKVRMGIYCYDVIHRAAISIKVFVTVILGKKSKQKQTKKNKKKKHTRCNYLCNLSFTGGQVNL